MRLQIVSFTQNKVPLRPIKAFFPRFGSKGIARCHKRNYE